MQQLEDSLTLQPLYVPGFIKQLREIISSEGSLPRAVDQLFKERNISIEVHGDTSIFRQGPGERKRGVLVIGDHRQGLESAPALAFLGKMGRDDVSFLAKPYSVPAKLINAAIQATAANRTVLPVVPPELTKDQPSPWFSGDAFFKFMNRSKLLSLAEAARVNIRSLKSAAQQLGEGHCVVISPTSGVKDSLKEQWEKGLGIMLRNVPKEERDDVHVVYARIDDFKKGNLIGSLTGVRKGGFQLTLRLSDPISLSELMEDSNTRDKDTQMNTVREKILASFRRVHERAI